MNNKKILYLLSFYLIAALLMYSWVVFLFTDTHATWRHYMALALFIVPVLLYLKNEKAAIIAVGCYLLVGITSVLSMIPEVSTFYFGFGATKTPDIDIPSLALLLLHYILNFDLFSNIFHAKQKE